MSLLELYAQVRAKRALEDGRRSLAAGDAEHAITSFERASELSGADPETRRAALLYASEASQGVGATADSLRHLRALSELDPSDVSIWRRMAAALEQTGESEAAAGAWSRVLELNPSDAQAHDRLAELLSGLGRVAQAIPHLRAIAESRSDEAESWRRLARALAASRDAAPAVEAWRKVLDLVPSDAEGHEQLAELLSGLGRTAEAIPHLGALAQIAEGDIKPWRRLALALDKSEDAATAVEAWRHVLSLRPSDEEAHERLAALLSTLGRTSEAKPHLEAVAQASPGDAEAWRRLARTLETLGETEAAGGAWRTVLGLADDDAEAHQRLAVLLDGAAEAIPHLRFVAESGAGGVGAWRGLAQAHARAGDGAAAAGAWRRVLDLKPSDAEADHHLAEWLCGLGRASEAVPHLRGAAQASEGEADPRRRLARALEQARDPEKAVDAWRQVLEISPADSEAHERLAELLYDLGRGPETIPHLRIVTQGPQGKTKPRQRLARALEDAGDVDASIDAWRRVLDLSPADAESHRRLASILQGLGRNAEALPHVAELAQAAPADIGAWKRLARLQEQLGKVEPAIETWRQVLAIDPNNGEPHDRLGEVLSGLGRFSEALPHLRMIAEAEDRKTKPWQRLARALEQTGDRTAAVDAWRRVLTIDPADLEALQRLSWLLGRLKRPIEAAPYLRTLAEGADNSAKAWLRLARCLKQISAVEEELGAWRRVLLFDSQSAEAHGRLAHLLSRSGRLVEASEHLRRLAEARPDQAARWKQLARTLEIVGDRDGAVAAWRRTLTVEPDDDESHGRLVELFEQSDRKHEAIRHLRALAKGSARAKPWRLLARALEEDGAVQDAASAWRSLLKTTPDDLEANERLASIHLDQGRKAQAVPYLRALARLETDRPERSIALARTCADLGDSQAAIQAWRDAVKGAETDPETHYEFALLLNERGLKGEAAEHFRVFAQARPGDHLAWRRLARCYRDLGDADREMAAWRQVLAITGADAEARNELESSGRTGEGQSLIEGVVSYASSLLSFWQRVEASDPAAALNISRPVFAQILEALGGLVQSAKIQNPDGVEERRIALGRVFEDPRFGLLAAKYPEDLSAFVESARPDDAERTLLVQGVLPALSPPDGLERRLKEKWQARVVLDEVSERSNDILAGDWFDSPVLICGFHHSGTRLLAQALEAAGVFQRANTPSYEWSFVQWLNTLILPGWTDPDAIRAFDGREVPPWLDHQEIAFRLAASGYDGGGAWGQKDPRNSVTAQAWLSAFPKLRIINITRTPLDVLGTLPEKYARFTPDGARPQDRMDFWCDLWAAYLAKTRDAMGRAVHSVEISFEDLCSRPVDAISGAMTGLGLDGGVTQADLAALSIDTRKVGEHRKWLASGALTRKNAALLEQLASQYGLD